MRLLIIISFVMALMTSCSSDDSKEITAERTAFVRNQELYNAFEMTKESKAVFERSQQESTQQQDSLRMAMMQLEKTITASNEQSPELIMEYERLQGQFMQNAQTIESDQEMMQQEHFQSIWKRLNAYVAEYAKEEGYTFVYGATGDGTLMYAESSKDITEELIQYCNQKYLGN